jgi:hypothetical protein
VSRKLRIFKMNQYDWVVARSRQEAIDWYDKEFGYDETEGCSEIRYNQKFWVVLGDPCMGRHTAKWFLDNCKYNPPQIIFSTEY